MGMVFTEHFTDGISALTVRLGGGDTVFIHIIEDTAMNGLQAVANVGQRTRNDNAHRIIEERLAHLAVDIDIDDLTGAELGMLHHLFVFRLKILIIINIHVLVLIIQRVSPHH